MPETSATTASTHTPVAVSPLLHGPGEVQDGGWRGPAAGPAAGEVTVVDLCALAKVYVRSDDASAETTLGTPFGRAARSGDRLVVGSGPGEWFVLAPAGTGAHVATELAGAIGGFTTVVDQSHGRALMRVQGPRTLDLLRRLTAMDLDGRFLPDGSAFRTSLARVVTDIVRDDVDGEPSYLLHCERSSGRYLADCLLEAGSTWGAALVGAEQPATI